MPFMTDTLPPEVEQLPKEAQAIWMSVFNSTFRTFSGSDEEKEDASFKAAWGAVKSRFARDASGEWTRKAALSFDDGPLMKSEFKRFVKFTQNPLEATNRITIGEVYVPWEVDSHGDFADEETIQEGAYNWMAKYQAIGEQHALFEGKGIVVENFISRKSDSDFPVPGTWVLGVQWSEDMWEKVLNGEVNGYSLAGKGISVALVAAPEYAKDVRLSKSNEMMGELDPDLFEEPQHEGPRVISQIIKLDCAEVSGVTTPATRKHFKLFKGETMNPRVHVVARKAEELPSTPETEEKADPAVMWKKLYQQLISDGYTPEEAKAFAESVLGPAPPGMLKEEEQAESLGILKSIKSAIVAVAKSLGVSQAEAQEDLPMTPQETERFNALEKNVESILKALAPKEEAVAKCDCATGTAALSKPAANLTVEEKAAAPVEEEEQPVAELAQLNADMMEVAKAVLELTKRFDAFESAPGVSGVEMALVPAGGEVSVQKSANGWDRSSILGAPIPAGARQAVVAEATARQERLNARRDKASNINLRMP